MSEFQYETRKGKSTASIQEHVLQSENIRIPTVLIFGVLAQETPHSRFGPLPRLTPAPVSTDWATASQSTAHCFTHIHPFSTHWPPGRHPHARQVGIAKNEKSPCMLYYTYSSHRPIRPSSIK